MATIIAANSTFRSDFFNTHACFPQLRGNDFDSRQCVIGHNSGNFFSIP
jgi:hypothetical protein